MVIHIINVRKNLSIVKIRTVEKNVGIKKGNNEKSMIIIN